MGVTELPAIKRLLSLDLYMVLGLQMVNDTSIKPSTTQNVPQGKAMMSGSVTLTYSKAWEFC